MSKNENTSTEEKSPVFEKSAFDLEKSDIVDTKPAKTSGWTWKLNKDDSPPEIFNRTLFGTMAVFAFLGAQRGLDEGGISGSIALPSFRNQFGLNDKNKSAHEIAELTGNITSMVHIGSIGGALLATYTVDRFGRIRCMQGVCACLIASIVIQITALSVGQLHAGRLLEGFCVGHFTTIGPLYASEVAPKAIRGMCVSIYSGAVYFGIMMGYAVSYGAVLHISDTSRLQWQLGVATKICNAGLIFVFSFILCYESPRWLLKSNQPDKAIANLSKLRNLPADHPYIVGEISDINEQVLVEREAVSRSTLWGQFKDLFIEKSIAYRFWAVCFLSQILGQWSGATAITTYANQLFGMAGIKGNERLKYSLFFGVVKFVAGYLLAFFLIDWLGRRRSLYVGISIQFVCILYFAIFLTILPNAGDDGVVLTSSQQHAASGAMAALYLSGVGWCMGLNCLQYLLGSEVFPLYIRSFAQSLTMAIHFANQYATSKALPKMLISMKPNGSFFLFVGDMFLALFWCWFFVPEVAGRSLESMEEIFNLPWYLIGRKGPSLCPDYTEINKIHYDENVVDENHISYVDKPTLDFTEKVEVERLR